MATWGGRPQGTGRFSRQVGGFATSRRPFVRWWTFAATIGLLVSGMAVASAALSSDFADEAVITGLTQPTNVEFAPNGRVFVAEKSGRIKVFDSVEDTTPTLFADLSSNVHDFWDRGLLGLAIHPNFPSTPYIYVLYTHGEPLSGATPTWSDNCPSPPGATTDGCVVSARLSRLQASGNQMTGSEVVLIEDWCQQYPSHSIGDLAFGHDGALYVTSGDGASFNGTDWGQLGGSPGSPTPVNPCGDPSRQGGALRSQDLRTGGDPVTLDGTILRVDPMTGDALDDNPGSGGENQARIIAYGLRNPFRMAIDPDSGAVYVGDVGWNTWEEVNRVQAPTGGVLNFGWPCYEGGNGSLVRHGSYDSADLPICETLYSSPGSVTAPLFAYHHNSDITASDDCPPANPPQGTSSSISGLAFYDGGNYPGTFNGALFGSDYSRNCIWVMYRNASGNLSPGSVEVFQPAASGPADLEIGPNGDLHYVNLNDGEVRRIRFVGNNTPPVASIDADVVSGSAPLTVDFDGSGSTDPDDDDIVGFAWDLDGDGQFDDATGPEVTRTFAAAGSHLVRLRVTDARGETGTDSITIQASNGPPVAAITAPSSSNDWRVGETIAFTGRGDDPDQGRLPASALTWEIIMHHCETDGTCHQHFIQTLSGVAGGSLVAPDHEYPSWIELRLTVRDQFGVEDVASVDLDPEIVDLVFKTDPAGLEVSFAGESETTPFARTLIVGATVEISTQSTQSGLAFQSWSHGGGRIQSFTAPESNTTYMARFGEPLPNKAPTIVSGGAAASAAYTVDEGRVDVVDVESTDPNGDVEGSGLGYAIVGGADRARFQVGTKGMLRFKSPPSFESPADANGDNVYVVVVRVTDSGGLTDSQEIRVRVRGVDGPNRGEFRDDDDSQFETAIEWMASEGITAGCNPPANDRFCPDDFVTRGQMAAFFSRGFGWSDAGGGDLFVDDDDVVFEGSIDLMATAGVTRGCNPPANDRFCPDDFVTRGQMAAFFMRAFN
jgi:glucose/arabinose dehydrogenase